MDLLLKIINKVCGGGHQNTCIERQGGPNPVESEAHLLSLSKFAQIKIYLRTAMTHERLCALCLWNDESSDLKMIQFDKVVKDFSDAK